MGHEFDDVEQPFIDQCVAMGWQAQTGNMDDPALTGRSSFKDVIAEATLRERLRAINPGPDGKPWLDDARLQSATTTYCSLAGGTIQALATGSAILAIAMSPGTAPWRWSDRNLRSEINF